MAGTFRLPASNEPAGLGVGLGDVLQFPDPLLSFNWVIKSLTTPQVQFDTAFLKKYVESVDAQLPTFEVEPQGIQASKVYFAGFNNIGTVNITFIEDSSGSVLSRIYDWQKSICDFQGNYGPASAYKGTLAIQLLAGVKSNLGTKILTYRGVWPSAIQQLSLNGSSEIVKIIVTLSCDGVEIT